MSALDSAPKRAAGKSRLPRPDTGPAWRSFTPQTWALIAGGVVLLLVAPFVAYPVFLMKAMCFAIFAVAFNLLLGFTGLLSFGHAAFFGSASYLSAHALKVWGFTPEFAILFAAVCSALLGLVFGAIAIRRQGIYFAMITLALSQMVFFFALQADFTGGEDGIQGVPRNPLFGVIDLSDNLSLYYFIALIFVLSLFAVYRTVHSPFGQVLRAIRESEPRAKSLGYETDRYKLAAFVISAGLAGVAGGAKAMVMQVASLTDVAWQMSGEVVLMTLLGGMGTVFGPAVGAFAIVALQNYLSAFGSLVTIVTGAIFVVCVLTFRRGIVGEIQVFLDRRKAAKLASSNDEPPKGGGAGGGGPRPAPGATGGGAAMAESAGLGAASSVHTPPAAETAAETAPEGNAMTLNPYAAAELNQNSANYAPLTPVSLIARTAEVFPDRTAIVHGDVRRNWAETYARCRRLASALRARGVERDTTVSIMAPNIPEFVEAHFGVPMAGGVLNSINSRLDAEAIAFILRHGESKVLLTDRELSPQVKLALDMLETKPIVIDIDDPQAAGGELIGEMDYEAFLATGDPDFQPIMPEDEWQAIALNYTSGTTGDPKGVVYHHRGAYLNAIGNSVTWSLPQFPIYLWTLPMFHCNGWCFPWTITAKAGVHVCLRKVDGSDILQLLEREGVTHLCGAPIVMAMMINAPEAQAPAWSQKISMMTAGASPPAAIIASMEQMGIEVVHVYGLTEVYGPCVVCAWHPEWDAQSLEERATLKARQGVRYEMQEGLMVADPETMRPVPMDGQTMGEIFIRGNAVMKGYLKNPNTTADSFKGGWFHSGDLAVAHPNGYVEIKDRSKDIIISGGENISSIEVEDVLFKHPDVLSAAVVAKPDEKWGETPCAFIELKPGASPTEQEIIDFCRERMAHFKCPRKVVFAELPKTSTGKIQKFALRQKAKDVV